VLPDFEELFAVYEHHGVEVGQDVAHAVGRYGIELGDDAEGRDGGEVVGVFVDEGELGSVCAYAEVWIGDEN